MTSRYRLPPKDLWRSVSERLDVSGGSHAAAEHSGSRLRGVCIGPPLYSTSWRPTRAGVEATVQNRAERRLRKRRMPVSSIEDLARQAAQLHDAVD